MDFNIDDDKLAMIMAICELCGRSVSPAQVELQYNSALSQIAEYHLNKSRQ